MTILHEGNGNGIDMWSLVLSTSLMFYVLNANSDRCADALVNHTGSVNAVFAKFFDKT